MTSQQRGHPKTDSGLLGLRVALVGPLPPPYGGMANQTKQLARLLAEEGVKVEVVRNNEPYRPYWIERIRGVRAIVRLIYFVGALWRIMVRSDLIHVMANSGWAWHLFTAPTVWMAWLRKRPVVINYRGGGAERFFKKSWLLVQPTIKLAKVVTVPSGYLQAIFHRRGIEAEIVPNIIDLSRFSPNGRWQAERSKISDDWPHIVVTRNLEPIYDIETAIRAFKTVLESYPKAILTVAGIGPDLDKLKLLSAQLDITKSIQFVGRLSNEQIATLYQEADLMINPSLVDNMPISILEAIASGVPVVSTNVGGIPYMVSSFETAILVNPGDDKTIAEAAQGILINRDLACELVKNGLEHIKKYEWDAVKKRLFKVYKGVYY